jgi:hypothetical protein
MIIKLAFRNLVRMPWRTVLYFLVVFFLVVAVTASVFVYTACTGAKTALDEAYIFVASLVPKDVSAHVSLRDIGYCLSGADIISYNVSMSENEGVIAGGANMFRLPEKVAPEDAAPIWNDEASCKLVAVENLYLTYPFFTGECTIIEGTGLTADGYGGNRAELVIPWWLAEQYGISVGDTLIRRYYRQDYSRFTFFESVVVGIYKSDFPSSSYEDYPAYLPLAVAELDYGSVTSGYLSSTASLWVDRADFVLKGRGDFDAFVRNAEKNGLDFQQADILFNNSSYDVLSEELRNICVIAVLVFAVVLLVGLGVLIFFTAYFSNSRRKEKEILRALGMKKRAVSGMIMTELAIIVAAAAVSGFFGGRLAAGKLCRYVNDTVLAEAAESAVLRAADAARQNPASMALERETTVEISLAGGRASVPEVPINARKTIRDGEIGVNRHIFYDFGVFETFQDNIWTPTAVVGISDIGSVKTSISFDEVQALPNYYEDFVYAFVSEEVGFEGERKIIHLGAHDREDYRIVTASGIMDAYLPRNTAVIVVGTYEENEYCSGTDILVRLEDYQRLYSALSVTDGDFYFERIDTVLKKESDSAGGTDEHS